MLYETINPKSCVGNTTNGNYGNPCWTFLNSLLSPNSGVNLSKKKTPELLTRSMVYMDVS